MEGEQDVDPDLNRHLTLLPTEIWIRVCSLLDIQSKINFALTCNFSYDVIMYPDIWDEMNLTQFGLCSHLTPECSVVSRCDSFCDRNWMVENLYQWMRERIWNFINWYIERQFVLKKLTFSFNFGSTTDEFADMMLSLISRVEFKRPLAVYADWKFTRNKTLELYQNHRESSMERNRIRIENFWHFLHVLRQREAPLVQFTTVFDWSHTSIQYLSSISSITHLSLLRLYAMETVSESTVSLLFNSLPNLVFLNLEVSVDEETQAAPLQNVDRNAADVQENPNEVVENDSRTNSIDHRTERHYHQNLRILDLSRCRSHFKFALDMPQLQHLKLSRMVGGKYRNTWDRLWSRCFEENFNTLPRLQCITVDSKNVDLINDEVDDFVAIARKRLESLKHFCQCSKHARHGVALSDGLWLPSN